VPSSDDFQTNYITYIVDEFYPVQKWFQVGNFHVYVIIRRTVCNARKRFLCKTQPFYPRLLDSRRTLHGPPGNFQSTFRKIVSRRLSVIAQDVIRSHQRTRTVVFFLLFKSNNINFLRYVHILVYTFNVFALYRTNAIACRKRQRYCV